MQDPFKEKLGLFKQLVAMIKNDLQSVLIAALGISLIYVLYTKDNDKDKMYGMVIEEVRKQVPKEVSKEVTTQVAPIREASDSTKAKADSAITNVNGAVSIIKDYIIQKSK
jgi:hypothetical protein